jgi:hypothetical protein
MRPSEPVLVRIAASLDNVGEDYEVVDLRRLHRFGEAVEALLVEIEREHPGVPVLEHIITIRSEPAESEPGGPVLIK